MTTPTRERKEDFKETTASLLPSSNGEDGSYGATALATAKVAVNKVADAADAIGKQYGHKGKAAFAFTLAAVGGFSHMLIALAVAAGTDVVAFGVNSCKTTPEGQEKPSCVERTVTLDANVNGCKAAKEGDAIPNADAALACPGILFGTLFNAFGGAAQKKKSETQTGLTPPAQDQSMRQSA